MKPTDNGGGGGFGSADGAPEKPGKGLAFLPRTPAGGLYLSAALLIFSFLSHILLLFLVEPLKVLALPKASAYAYSGAPLVVGVFAFLSAIFCFRRIAPRSDIDFVVLIVAIIFGSLSLQGLAGVILFFVKGPQGAEFGHSL
ncbi:MAG: hypothetical protein L0Y60_10020 [Beijerinckiaceae bacterium]|nr:hypothetical protein [Beijerinckiaceae bacterium]